MNKSVVIILSILFLVILLGSLGFFIYNVFNNTAYPDESENLVNTHSDNAEDLVNTSDTPKSLSQLTLEDAIKNMTELPLGYSQHTMQSRFQCVLPLFLDN